MEISRKSPESKEGLSALGVAVFLRDRDTGKYYVGMEMQDKPDLKREVGVISVITETAKVGEGLYENLIGALGEYPVSEDDKFYISDNSYLGVTAFAGKGECHVFLMDVETSTKDLSEVNSLSARFTIKSELRPVAWMEMDEMLELDDLRYGTKELIDWVQNQEGLASYLERDDSNDVEFSSVAEIERYVEEREELSDVRGDLYN